MAFIRKIRKGKNVYLQLVESRRIDGKVVQRHLKYLGKEIEGRVVKRVNPYEVEAESVKHCADVLVIDKMADLLGLKNLFNDKNILAFVYSHLLERPSIRKLGEWFSYTEIPEILGLEKISTQRLYETLGELSEMDFTKVEEGIFSKLKDYERGRRSIIIDVTDTYFEGSSIEDEPRRGKDGRYKKLIQVGLGITERYGFPVMMRTYAGNISNFMIFKDLFAALVEKGFKSVVIDRGMGCEENIRAVEIAQMSIISGLRKTPNLKRRYLDRIKREEIYCPAKRVALKKTAVYIQEFDYFKGKLIVVYNPQMEVVRREIIYEGGGREEEAKYVGYSFIYHNTDLSSEEVVKKYYEKEIIERAFKKLKGILSLRPIRVWTKEHIEGHIRVCYVAYAILSLLEYYLAKGRFELSALELLEKLKRGYRIYLKDSKSNFSWTTTVLLEKELYKLLDYLGVVYKNE